MNRAPPRPVFSINRATVVALRQTVEGAAGRAALQVVASSDAGMPEDVLARVRAVPGVAIAVAVVEGPVLGGNRRRVPDPDCAQRIVR